MVTKKTAKERALDRIGHDYGIRVEVIPFILGGSQRGTCECVVFVSIACRTVGNVVHRQHAHCMGARCP